MKHKEIRESEIIDRYVLGKLNKDEERRFEEHFLDCVECQDQLKQGYLFQGSLKKVAAEELAGGNTKPSDQKPLKPESNRWIITVAAIFMLAMVTGMLFKQTATWRKRLSEKDIVIESLSADLSKLSTPRVNEPRLFIETQRDAIGQDQPPVNAAVLTPRDSWLSLTLRGAFKGYRDFRLSLSKESGDLIWKQSGLRPDTDGQFSLALPRSLLAEGRYILVLEVFSQNRFAHFATYPFQVTIMDDAPSKK